MKTAVVLQLSLFSTILLCTLLLHILLVGPPMGAWLKLPMRERLPSTLSPLLPWRLNCVWALAKPRATFIQGMSSFVALPFWFSADCGTRTEYSTQCYCGNTFSAGSVPADESSCSMACGGESMSISLPWNMGWLFPLGDKLQTCGGSDRLTTFKFDNNAASNSSSITASATASVTANESTSSSYVTTAPSSSLG